MYLKILFISLIQDEPSLGCWRMEGGRRGVGLPYLHILPKEDPKNIWIMWYIPCVLLTYAIFHWKSVNFAISRNTNMDCILLHNFLILLTFFESLKMVLKNMVKSLTMSAITATLGLFKIKVFWNKDYDVIISVHSLDNKIWSCD